MTDTNQYRETIQREFEQLSQLRDELRVQLHLAKADAKDEWNRLEKTWLAVQSEVRNAAADAKMPLQELSKATRHLLDELKRGYERVRAQLS